MPIASLAAKVATQRRNYRVFMSESDEPSGMTAERVRQLEAISFDWTVSPSTLSCFYLIVC